MRKIVTGKIVTGIAAAGLVAGTVASGSLAAASSDVRVKPLAQAHAHNDYEHGRPLVDALDHGFTSVEADIWLVDGALLVAHDAEDLDPTRTLEGLYLDPLADLVEENGGTVYPGKRKNRHFQLLIDIKSTGEDTYAALDAVLADPTYKSIFSRYKQTKTGDEKVRMRGVTAVISGDRPRATMEAQTKRFAFYDGRIANPDDLGPGDDAKIVPLVSDNWGVLLSWRGVGEMPADERAELQEIVDTAHAVGQRVRFWATPDAAGPEREAIWDVLVEAGVDHINTDDLAGLEDYLRSQD